MRIEIPTLLPWSEPKRVMTSRGHRDLRTATPNEAFWSLWRTSKGQLRDAGISVSKRDRDWQVCWWTSIDEAADVDARACEAASRALDADIDVPAPAGLNYLPFQRGGIAFSLARANVLIGDEMGLGKTIQTIGVINADTSLRNILIIVPASLKLNWQREIEKWLTRPVNVVQLSGKTAHRIPLQDPAKTTNVVIINYDIVAPWHPFLSGILWDLRVMDECHRVKNPKAQRTKAILGGKGVAPIRARRKLSLGGTPILNRPKELFPIINDLDPATWPKFFTFAKRYCDAHQTRFGWDFDGASNLEELQRKLRSTIMVRRLKTEVLQDLPAKRRQVIEFELTAATRQAVQAEREAMSAREGELSELQAAVEVALATGDEQAHRDAVKALKAGTTVAFQAMSQVRHATAVAKLPDVISHVQGQLDDNGKAILFAHHRDVVEALTEAFAHEGAVCVYGGMSNEDKQGAVDAFQNDERCRVFVGSITAAGVGLTLTAASLVIFTELDWVPGNLTQAEDRAHRIGQTDSVLVQHLVLEGSLDATMAKRVVEKQEVIDQALDSPLPEIEASTPVLAIELSDEQQQEIAEAKRAAAEEVAISEAQARAIHAGLKLLSAMCDGARALDGAGFNKMDAGFGHSVASQEFISQRQARYGMRLVNKYRRQLPEDLVAAAKGGAS